MPISSTPFEGHLKLFLLAWRAITMDKWVLDIMQSGYVIEFMKTLPSCLSYWFTCMEYPCNDFLSRNRVLLQLLPSPQKDWSMETNTGFLTPQPLNFQTKILHGHACTSYVSRYARHLLPYQCTLNSQQVLEDQSGALVSSVQGSTIRTNHCLESIHRFSR